MAVSSFWSSVCFLVPSVLISFSSFSIWAA